VDRKGRILEQGGFTLDQLTKPAFEGGSPLALSVTTISAPAAGIKNVEKAFQVFFQTFRDCREKKVKDTLAWIFAFYCRQNGWGSISPKLLKDELLGSRTIWTSEEFSIDRETLLKDQDGWSEFLDAAGRMQNFRCAGANTWNRRTAAVDLILKMFLENTSKVGILRILGFWFAVEKKIPTDLKGIPSIDQFDDPKYKLAAMLVKLSQRDISNSEVRLIAAQLPLVIGTGGEPQARDILVTALERHSENTTVQELLLPALTDLLTEEEWQLRGRVHGQRIVFVHGQTSGLDAQLLDQLKLPYSPSAPMAHETS
jgi:hypothetical protein